MAREKFQTLTEQMFYIDRLLLQQQIRHPVDLFAFPFDDATRLGIRLFDDAAHLRIDVAGRLLAERLGKRIARARPTAFSRRDLSSFST